MNLSEALDIVVARTGHVRYRDLCDPKHPAFDPTYPPWIISQAHKPAATSEVQAQTYPSIGKQVVNAAGAAVRFVASGFARVDEAEALRRLAICQGCEHFDAGQDRCRKCACWLAYKAYAKSEKCPVAKW